MSRCRLALVCDYPEEQWPSMDLTGEMIRTHLGRAYADAFEVVPVCPPFRRRLSRWPIIGRRSQARNADRLLNRFVDYPRALAKIARQGEIDLYHLVDHSYGQLVHVLPAERTVVTCHDLDTFRCLLEPDREPRPRWFRAMTRRILDGVRQAAVVVCDSEATRAGLRAFDLVPEARLRVVYLGTHPECSPAPNPWADAEADRLLGPPEPDAAPDLLHVGSNIPRKRIDVLLATFAGVRREFPDARLVKVGGAFTAEQEQLARALGVADAVVPLPYFSPRDPRDRAILAAVYRRAALVLQPSDAEGFGLPVAEALACGVPLLASDIPVLREVGADAPVYAPVGDIPAWTESALALIDAHRRQTDAWLARRAAGLARAQRFQWSSHVNDLVEIYHSLGAHC
jgi:glycosyltransferase involved in cell wall biosynthesis